MPPSRPVTARRALVAGLLLAAALGSAPAPVEAQRSREPTARKAPPRPAPTRPARKRGKAPAPVAPLVFAEVQGPQDCLPGWVRVDLPWRYSARENPFLVMAPPLVVSECLVYLAGKTPWPGDRVVLTIDAKGRAVAASLAITPGAGRRWPP